MIDQQVRDHCAQCPPCGAVLGEMKCTQEALSQRPQAAVPADLAGRICQAMDQNTHCAGPSTGEVRAWVSPKRRRWDDHAPPFVTAAAACTAAVAAGVFATQMWPDADDGMSGTVASSLADRDSTPTSAAATSAVSVPNGHTTVMADPWPDGPTVTYQAGAVGAEGGHTAEAEGLPRSGDDTSSGNTQDMLHVCLEALNLKPSGIKAQETIWEEEAAFSVKGPHPATGALTHWIIDQHCTEDHAVIRLQAKQST